MKLPHIGTRAAGLSLLCILLAVLIFVWIQVLAATPRGVLRVAFLDVGQGDAIYIESPTGRQLIIDGGPDDSLLPALPKVMPPFDRSIDALLETHPDSDHITGFVDLLKRYTVTDFIEPGIPKDTETATTLEKEITDNHVARYIARRGMAIDLGGGALLQILYPDHDVSTLNQNIANNGAIVARLSYGSTSVLFTSDLPKEMMDTLASQADGELKSDILKVGHHGSKTASDATIINAVHPTDAVIEVAAKNMYHLPNQEPLDELAAVGASVFRTDRDGTVLFESDGTHFWRVQ